LSYESSEVKQTKESFSIEAVIVSTSSIFMTGSVQLLRF